ncbi:DMT family transporter [Pseudonocardia sp. NPDC049635]|uniref:DMT family transporter n=1 Tax=Pseudonocardia sp. NPDC049635 TaxID=3155506 RepID=UPI0033F06D6C
MGERVGVRVGLGAAAVFAAAVLWGTVGPAQVLAEASIDATTLGAARLLVGGLALLVVVPLLDHPARGRWAALARGSALRWLVLAAVSTAAYQAAFLSSVERTGAALATVVALGVAPPAVGVMARAIGAERLTRSWLLGTGAAVVGTTLLLLPGASGGIDAIGIGLGIIGGLCYGVYTVSAKVLLDGPAPTFAAVALTLVLGGAVLLPFARLDGTLLTEPGTVLLIAWLAIPATAGGYVLFVAGLRHISAATAGTLSLAEPLVAVVLGVAFLGERMSLIATVGAVVLLTGLVAVTAPRHAGRGTSAPQDLTVPVTDSDVLQGHHVR